MNSFFSFCSKMSWVAQLRSRHSWCRHRWLVINLHNFFSVVSTSDYPYNLNPSKHYLSLLLYRVYWQMTKHLQELSGPISTEKSVMIRIIWKRWFNTSELRFVIQREKMIIVNFSLVLLPWHQPNKTNVNSFSHTSLQLQLPWVSCMSLLGLTCTFIDDVTTSTTLHVRSLVLYFTKWQMDHLMSTEKEFFLLYGQTFDWAHFEPFHVLWHLQLDN